METTTRKGNLQKEGYVMFQRWMIATVFLLSVVCVGSVSASVVYTLNESFDAPTNGVPTDWMMQDYPVPDSGAGDSAYITQLTEGDNRLYQFRNTTTGERRSLVGYTGTMGGNLDQAGRLGNFTASVVVRPVENDYSADDRTIQFRASQQQYFNSGGYLAVLNGDGTQIRFTKDPVDHNNIGSTIGSVNIPGMDLDADYLFTVSAVGNRFSAAVYEWNTTANDWSTTPMGSLVVNDDTYTEGYFGFRSAFVGQAGTYWSDLKLSLVGEGTIIIIQ